jgi:hypothetical protein
MSSGASPYRFDSVMRAPYPPMPLCATIRMVSSSNAGPPVVMLGDQALTRVPRPGVAASAVVTGRTAGAVAASAAESATAVFTGCIVFSALVRRIIGSRAG